MARRNYLIAEEIQSHKENPYRNELFHKKRLRTKWQKRLGFIIPSVFLFTIVISLLLSPFFRFSEVSVTGLTTLNQSAVDSAVHASLNRRVLGIFPRRQTPFFRKTKLEEDLGVFDLASIEITTKNRVLSIILKERVSEIIVRAGEGYQLIDLNGDPTRAPTDEELVAITQKIANRAGEMTLTTLQPTAPVISVVGDYTSPSHPLRLTGPSYLLDIDALVRSLGFVPYLYTFENDREGWFIVSSANRPDLYLDSKTALPELRRTLDIALKEIESLESLRYIDARFGSAIYYR